MSFGFRLRALAIVAAVALAGAGALFGAAPPATAQAVVPPRTDEPPAMEPPGGAPAVRTDAEKGTGGAQTLEDILRRQKGLKVDDSARRAETGQPVPEGATRDPLGTLGLKSNSDLYRAMRYNEGDVTASIVDPKATILVQDSGMEWLSFRAGPLREYGAWTMGGMLALLALFYLLRGRIRIDKGRSGVLIERFDDLERFGHWLTAGSFILLALTGLNLLFGRVALIPLIGKDAYAQITIAGKWVHNNVAWAFMAGLVLIFVMWVLRNIPDRHDVVWILKGGGLFSKGVHPPAKKFNAGQKVIFWLVILLGASVSASGLSLLFPFDMPLFAKTFGVLNDLGFAAIWGAPLPTDLTPHQEMMLAEIWHSIVAFAMIAVILAHIYIGTLGMEGAFDAMGSGHVDRNWALEHHGLWVEEEEARARDAAGKGAAATPAE